MAEMRVNKVDAARRQIETAIKLLFSNGDPVAIHTLVAAGGRIVRDLCERRNTPGYILTKSLIKPGKEKAFHTGLSRATNFLKHADRDSEDILENVREEVNEHLIMLACMFYRDLGYTRTTAMAVFEAWYCAINPEAAEEGLAKVLLDNLFADSLRNMNRQEQLESGRELLLTAKHL